MDSPAVLERIQLNAIGSEAGSDNSGSASGNNRHQLAFEFFLSAASAENGLSLATGVRRRLEYCARLARIWIEAEDKKLGGNRAEIDDARRSTAPSRIHSASGLGRQSPSDSSEGACGTKSKIDIFRNFIGNRLKRHDASLAHGRGNMAGNPQAAASLPAHIEIGFETGQIAQPRRFCYRRARLRNLASGRNARRLPAHPQPQLENARARGGTGLGIMHGHMARPVRTRLDRGRPVSAGNERIDLCIFELRRGRDAI